MDITDHSPRHPKPSPPVPTASNLVLIDNYDSFTWNVYQYLVLEGAIVTVIRNDKITLEELIAKKPTQLVISPGPGHPNTDSGISRDAIRHFAGKIPIFGVCMGLQCVFDVYGGDVGSAGEILHGKTSPLSHDSKGVYAGLSQQIPVTRYHSLAGTPVTLPSCLEVTATISRDDGSQGVIMGVRHKEYTIEAVQFHPESILSADGRAMVRNFLHFQGGTWAENERLQKAAPAASVEAGASGSQPQPPASGKDKGPNILQRIYAHRKAAVEAQKQVPSQRPADLAAAYALNAAPPQISLVDRLRQSPFAVALMAEVKRASPSKGVFALDMDAPTQARQYALAGASVISVLTEPAWFKGGLDDLRAVRAVVDGLPGRPAVLRKEFVFDEYQILEARLAGADTVLLIVKMLTAPGELERLYRYSLDLGMEPLVEVQNAEEMAKAIKLGAKVIGVNNRNLESFDVDLGTTGRLRSMVPEGTFLCALSGIQTHKDVQDCLQDGVNGILVGESIMRAPNARHFILELCAGPEAVAAAQNQAKECPQPLLVKICGTRTPEAAAEAVRVGADFVGVILVPGSKRCASREAALAIAEAFHAEKAKAASTTTPGKRHLPKTAANEFFPFHARTLASRVPLLVGVFMNQPLEDIIEMQQLYRLDLVQLHGDEPIEWASFIPVPVIRKFRPGQPGLGLRGHHALPLLDSGAGSGLALDTNSVKETLEKDEGLTVILAGGLQPDNVAQAVKDLGPLADRVLAVDVSSGVETDGKQDLDKIRAFVKAAKTVR